MDHFFAWLMGLLAFVPGLGPTPPATWNGYVEVDYVYAAATSSGRIDRIGVREGELVAAGDLLFVLEASQQQAQYDAAVARAGAAQEQVAASEATLANLRTGARPEELQVTQASLAQAEANLALAQQNFSRTEDLFEKGNVPRSQLDQAQASLDAANAAVTQLKAQLAVAQLPARNDQIAAAEASLAAAKSTATAAKADAATAKAMLELRTVRAPKGARVERLYFSVGEVANAGVPVVSLSGADALKVKFYVGETQRQELVLGETVRISCDGCGDGLTATIDHFAGDPQFTPPIIYSRDERQRLVFLTEATLDEASAIRPGQPVSIRRIE